MTLSDLLSALGGIDPTAPLVFTADGARIRGGYHVTEFQVAQIRSMTCGGDTDAWDEARIQLLDGHSSSDPMEVGRFLSIAARVTDRFPEMADLPLSVEFAPDNAGLRVFHPDRPVRKDGAAILPLISGQAVCKPALTTSCCGTGAACCAAA